MSALKQSLAAPIIRMRHWIVRSTCTLAIISTPICWAQHSNDAQSAKATPTSDDPEYLSKIQIGSATLNLLKLQTEGNHAGKSLPMLGSTTHLSWQRYQSSFKQEIPVTFSRTVKSSGAN